MRAEVIALGQELAGDDGVGLRVLARLRERAVPPGVTLRAAPDATALLPRLEERVPIVLVDAAVDGGPPGRVLTPAVAELAGDEVALLSSHGLSVVQALELAAALSPPLPPVGIVAVTIAPWLGGVALGYDSLSPKVAEAVDRAVDAVLEMVERIGA